jgi:hypothetical protein
MHGFCLAGSSYYDVFRLISNENLEVVFHHSARYIRTLKYMCFVLTLGVTHHTELFLLASPSDSRPKGGIGRAKVHGGRECLDTREHIPALLPSTWNPSGNIFLFHFDYFVLLSFIIVIL